MSPSLEYLFYTVLLGRGPFFFLLFQVFIFQWSGSQNYLEVVWQTEVTPLAIEKVIMNSILVEFPDIYLLGLKYRYWLGPSQRVYQPFLEVGSGGVTWIFNGDLEALKGAFVLPYNIRRPWESPDGDPLRIKVKSVLLAVRMQEAVRWFPTSKEFEVYLPGYSISYF